MNLSLAHSYFLLLFYQTSAYYLIGYKKNVFNTVLHGTGWMEVI